MVPDPVQTSVERPDPEDLEAAFRFYGRVTSDLVALLDRTARFLFVNAAAERVFGSTPEACRGLSLFDFVHPEDRASSRAALEGWLGRGAEGSLLVENRSLGRDGALRHLHWTMTTRAKAGGPLVCILAHARDVTLQILSAERQQRSELRHRAVLAASLDPMVTIDPRGTIQEASRSVESVLGYRPEELVGTNIKRLMPEPYSSEHDQYLERYRRTGQTGILNRTRQFDVLQKDGTVIQCELSVSRVDVPGEAEPLFVGSFRDVTARVRAEHASAESAARVRAIFDQEFQLVGLLATDGTLLEINESALRAVGAERAAVIGRPFWDTPWWRNSPARQERLRQAVARAAAGEFVRLELEYEDATVGVRWTDFSLKPVRDAEGRVQYLLPEGRDITRVKATHARELAMQGALAAIGESASILAHEIKNPLTAVNLALRAVADKLGEDQRVVLEDLALRLRKLERTMRRTLSFARPLELELQACDAGELVGEVAATLAPELEAARVRLELDRPGDLPAIRADHELLEEVLVNLVRNAREALGEGGRIRVALAREDKRHLVILVEDDGPGILPSLRADLFKPFVSSKASGTGLGLAIARKIVLEHGGEIGVRDGSLGGACFWMRLPLDEGAEANAARVRRRSSASA